MCLLTALTLSVLGAAVAAGGEARTYGLPLAGLEPVALSEVLGHPEDGRRVRLEGVIEAVCRKKGCWLELRQDENRVHVAMAGHAFGVPAAALGRPAAVEGKVVVRTPPEGDVEHLRSEGAGAAAAARVSIEATGVEVR